MSEITIEHNPSPAKLDVIGVYDWPIWTREVSTFAWQYEKKETCYFLEGDVIVTPEGGAPVHMGMGDLVNFPAGMVCTWQILEAVEKHYDIG